MIPPIAMIPESIIRRELGRTLSHTDFRAIGEKRTGKVRDIYRLDAGSSSKTGEGRLLLVVTDRISAFDRVLGTIPFKGEILNQLSAFWFEQTAGIAPNHLLDVPDPNVMVVAESVQLPIEVIVRGYITGGTKTSIWFNYERGAREYCGIPLPDGLRKNQALERPLVCLSTKLETHDRPISHRQAIDDGLVDAATLNEAVEICLRLYKFGADYAMKRGLILADAKYELGRHAGKLIVSDEMHTPDSSRYWRADTYDALLAAGQDQRSIDKDYVRDWLASRGFIGDGNSPAIPDDVRIETAKRYIEAYETITGREFEVLDEPAAERIAKVIKRKRYLSRK